MFGGAEAAKLVISLAVTNGPAMKALGDLQSRMAEIGRGAKSAFGQPVQRAFDAFGSIGDAADGMRSVANAVEAVAGSMVGGAAKMETFALQFEVLLGNAELAKERMADLADYANTTPFNLPGVVEASRLLQTFTDGALAAGDGLRLVGDIAAGTGKPIEDVAFKVGRMYDAFRSGTNIGESLMYLQEMGAISGATRREIEDLAKQVQTGAMTMDEAWSRATEGFGKFAGMTDKLAQSTEGKMSTAIDAVNMSMAKLGESLLPLVKMALDGVVVAMNFFNDVAEKLKKYFWILTPFIMAAVKALYSYVSAAWSATGATGMLATALKALPIIGWITLAITALEVFAAAWESDFMGIRTIVENAVKWIDDNFGWLIDILQTLAGAAGTLVGSIQTSFTDLTPTMDVATQTWTHYTAAQQAAIDSMAASRARMTNIYGGMATDATTSSKEVVEALKIPANYIRDNWVADGAAVVATAAKALLVPINREFLAASVKAIEMARMLPGEMGDALRAGRSKWITALQNLNEATKTTMTRGVEIAYLLAAMTSKSIVEGLKSGDDALRAQTNATVKVMYDRLVALQGPVYARAWAVGHGIPLALVAGAASVPGSANWLNEMMNPAKPLDVKPSSKLPDWLTGLDTTLAKVGGSGAGATKAVAATKEAVLAVKTAFAALGQTMLSIPDFSQTAAYKGAVAAYAGLSRASKLTGDAGTEAMQKISTAIEKATTAAQKRITDLQTALSSLQTKLASWPAMSAMGILGALEKVTQKLMAAWATLDAQQKTSAIKFAASEYIRAEEIGKLPADIQALYGLMDEQSAAVDRWQGVMDTAKQGSEVWKNANAEAVAAAVRVQKYTDLIQKLLEANALVLNATAALTQAQAEAVEGYTAPTGVEAATTALAAATAARAGLLADLGTLAVPAAGTAVGGLSPTVAAASGLPTAGNTTYINATVNVEGSTQIDPYGDFAQRLAAALIPGLQRELSRQGITLA